MGLSGEKWKQYDCVYICSRDGGCVLMGIVLLYEYIYMLTHFIYLYSLELIKLKLLFACMRIIDMQLKEYMDADSYMLRYSLM